MLDLERRTVDAGMNVMSWLLANDSTPAMGVRIRFNIMKDCPR